jgi:antitoxin MazE
MRSHVRRWGNSLAVRVPREVAAATAIEEGTEVEVAVEDGRVVLTPRPAAPTLDELVEAITPDNRHEETDWGAPRGREVW